MWQLMPFTSPTDGPDRPRHGTGTAAGCHSDRDRGERVAMEAKTRGAFKVVFMFVCCMC